MHIVFLMREKWVLKNLFVYVTHGVKRNRMVHRMMLGTNGRELLKRNLWHLQKTMAFSGCVRINCFFFFLKKDVPCISFCCIAWEEMSSFFSDITVCKIGANDHEVSFILFFKRNIFCFLQIQVRRRGQFSDFSSKITSAYTLDCPHEAELDIELFNAGDERYKNHSKSPDIDLFLIVLSSNGSCNAYKHSVDYYITLSTVVPPGQYIILAGSMSVVNYSIYSKFNLVVHATQPFVLNQRPSSPELVGNAFHAVALQANNRKDFGDGVSILSFNDNGFKKYILVLLIF